MECWSFGISISIVNCEQLISSTRAILRDVAIIWCTITIKTTRICKIRWAKIIIIWTLSLRNYKCCFPDAIFIITRNKNHLWTEYSIKWFSSWTKITLAIVDKPTGYTWFIFNLQSNSKFLRRCRGIKWCCRKSHIMECWEIGFLSNILYCNVYIYWCWLFFCIGI